VTGNAIPAIVGAPSRDDILAFKYGVITGSMVNIRTGAGTTNSIITTLPAGTPFEVKDYRAGWYKVSFSDGRVGWIAGWLVNTSLKPVAPAAPAPAPFGGELGGSFIASGRVTSEYGYRSDPFTGERRFHSGIDIGAPKGTSVLALGEGTVVSAAWNDGYGRLVKIRYDNGYTAYYAHLDDYAGMVPGKRISRGQTVGKVDSSGRSTGHHLHFELRNESGETLDPRSIASVVIP
jgi:murein DD-endopeptidase MepM/ murein hydrolase activator NlpD